MMELKFRAWDIKKKEFVKDFIIDLEGTIQRAIHIGSVGKVDESIGDYFELDFTDWYGIENIKLMQYIGLKDKNNKEIYNGDIVKTKDGYICKVIWDIDFARYQIIYPGGEMKIIPLDCEVIGNVYKNPELLSK